MTLYAGIDLHSNNSVLAILNTETEQIVYERRLKNELAQIKAGLLPYKEQLLGIAVESTYNWYWLVDGLKLAGYEVSLANPSAIKVYEGLKHTDDRDDARWLAKLLSLNILPTGHIYPAEQRGERELVRSRMKLVQARTRELLIIQSSLTRYYGNKLSANSIYQLTQEALYDLIPDEALRTGLLGHLNVFHVLNKEIHQLEKKALKSLRSHRDFKLLKTIPGVGDILALTILREVGNISRFKTVSHFSSYCRCAKSVRLSNGKKKGSNNRKNGNKYLAWAFVEAASYATRFNPDLAKYVQRKTQRTMRVVAIKALANKLTKACFFILRDQEGFDIDKMITR